MNIFTLGILPKHIWKNLTDEQFSLSSYNINAIGSGPFKILHVQEVKMCPCGFYSNEADTAKHHGWCSKSFDISYLELTLQANGSPERVNGRFFEVDE
jgi:hypothetical protein